MSDKDLRRLERKYSEDPTESNLYLLNVHRIRSGLAPLRPDPYFLYHWAQELHTLLKSTDDVDWHRLLDDTADRDAGFSGTIKLKKFEIAVEVVIYSTLNSEPDRGGPLHFISLEIGFAPLHSALSILPAYQLGAVFFDNTMRLGLPRTPPADYTLHAPYHQVEVVNNHLLSVPELIKYLIEIYKTESIRGWELLRDTPLATEDEPLEHLVNVLEAAEKIKREKDIFQKEGGCIAEAIQLKLLKESLRDFSTTAERKMTQGRLLFDLEQTWPVYISFSGGRYVIFIETGYNDSVVDLDEFDFSDPEGESHGLASNKADLFAEKLEQLTGVKWEAEWDYEEPYESGETEFYISIKAEAPLSTKLLLQILEIRRYQSPPK